MKKSFFEKLRYQKLFPKNKSLIGEKETEIIPSKSETITELL